MPLYFYLFLFYFKKKIKKLYFENIIDFYTFSTLSLDFLIAVVDSYFALHEQINALLARSYRVATTYPGASCQIDASIDRDVRRNGPDFLGIKVGTRYHMTVFLCFWFAFTLCVSPY